MLESSDTDFLSIVIKIMQWATTDTGETDKQTKAENPSKEIEDIKSQTEISGLKNGVTKIRLREWVQRRKGWRRDLWAWIRNERMYPVWTTERKQFHRNAGTCRTNYNQRTNIRVVRVPGEQDDEGGTDTLLQKWLKTFQIRQKTYSHRFKKLGKFQIG